jgi:hypothetical protein
MLYCVRDALLRSRFARTAPAKVALGFEATQTATVRAEPGGKRCPRAAGCGAQRCGELPGTHASAAAAVCRCTKASGCRDARRVAFADNPFQLWVLEGWVFVGLFVAVAVIPACVLAATCTWPASLTFLQLRFSQHTPLRLMRFFEDARERGVLRTVGPVYQFRHAHLQDRLGEKASAPVSTIDPSEATAV